MTITVPSLPKRCRGSDIDVYFFVGTGLRHNTWLIMDMFCPQQEHPGLPLWAQWVWYDHRDTWVHRNVETVICWISLRLPTQRSCFTA